MNYHPLFSLVLKHKYYEDLYCPDFDLVILPETADILRGHRFKSNILPDRIEVVGEADVNGVPLYGLPPNTVLRFGMIVDNPCFREITAESFPISAGVVVFNNSINTTTLQRQMAPFSQGLPIGKKWFGVLELFNNFSLPMQGGPAPEFSYTFAAKRLPLKYYVIAENPMDVFTVLDARAQISFFPPQLLILPQSGEAETLLAQFPGHHIFLIESTTDVPLHENGIEDLQLLKNGSPVILDLPSMAPDQPYRVIHATPILN